MNIAESKVLQMSIPIIGCYKVIIDGPWWIHTKSRPKKGLTMIEVVQRNLKIGAVGPPPVVIYEQIKVACDVTGSVLIAAAALL